METYFTLEDIRFPYDDATLPGFVLDGLAWPIGNTDGGVVCGTLGITPTVTGTLAIEVC